MDCSKYPIKQINSLNAGRKEDILRRIIELTADPFKGKLPAEVFIETEMRVARESKDRWHQFYIVDPNEKHLVIVCSLRIWYKRGNSSNFNLLIGNVHTTPKYRNRGFLRYMFSECIKKYEVPGHQFEAMGSDNEDADTFLAQNIDLKTYNYYWSLYSGVSELYSKFGFKSVPEMNWLIYKEPVDDKTIKPITPLGSHPGPGSTTTFITTDFKLQDINQYFSKPEYASYANSTPPALARSTNLDSPTVGSFYIRDQVVSSYYGQSYKYAGIKIEHGSFKKQTFAIICGAIDYSGILVQKLFTNLTVDSDDEKQALSQDLAYLVKFLRHVNVSDYCLLDLDFVSSIKFLVTTQDICTKDSQTHEYIVNSLQKNWKLDVSNKDFLPMMKDWAKPGISEGVTWINNGFWCFG